jgi:propionyl-CoA carboxylase alpha chain
MITNLLIANRGEIACRIARTAHAMGMSTVGVYSEPDRNALHVDAVDRAVALGGSTPAESYLRADAIIQAALDTGADAIHPGYGFLAENAEFAEAVTSAGLIWVGPTPEQIRLLGDKVAAKAAAVDAGVPTTSITEVAPGSIPDGVAMPALVKAAAGGGGRGMRIVRSSDDLADAVEAAAREAEAAFGDGTVFIEPYIERGRHLEVQILGDAHGNVVHFGERECSIQRRNQKVIEEAPSAGIDDATRAALLDGALALAHHVGYQNAGTVEFLVSEPEAGGAPTITFLEVNTRLQVEHPVTESVTGVDLVELQLRVAAGEQLPLTQDDVTISGHGIEVRIVAEDPAAGWMPSTGEVDVFRIGEGVRVDTGFRAGSDVSSDYDSLLAKVIAHAPTRAGAAAQMARALRGSQIVGVRTNVDMLAATMLESDYLDAATPTAYLAEHPQVEAAHGPDGDELAAMLVAATLSLEAFNRADTKVLGFAPSGWRNLRTRGQRQTWLDGDRHHQIEYVRCGDGAGIRLGAWPEPDDDGALPEDVRSPQQARVLNQQDHQISLEFDGVRRTLRVQLNVASDDAVVAHVSGPAGARSFALAPRFVDHDAEQAGGGPICPLPGTVIAVHVEDGQEVQEGQLLMVVEAMKMEHKITAGAPGTVTAVRFAQGDRVDTGDLLVELDAGHDPIQD